MLEIPQRESIINRVAGILETAIRHREWRRRLPSERLLCEQLHVSRATLEKALNILGRKGLIRSMPRVGHLIQKRSIQLALHDSSTIRVLLKEPYQNQSTWSQLVYGEIERIVAVAGFDLRFHGVAHLRGEALSRRLDQLVKDERAACWAICSVPCATQQWFMARHIPALVVGHCFPGVQLPAMDVDCRSISRHAVSLFLRLGHRTIVLLSSRMRLAGDWHGEEGFREGFTRMAPKDAHFEVWYHDMSPDSVRRLIRERWSKAGYPTAVLVSSAHGAIAAASSLMDMGLRLAHHVSLICRACDETLDWFTPPIASYVIGHRVFARRVARLLIRLAQTGAVKPGALLLPRLCPGGTVGRPS